MVSFGDAKEVDESQSAKGLFSSLFPADSCRLHHASRQAASQVKNGTPAALHLICVHGRLGLFGYHRSHLVAKVSIVPRKYSRPLTSSFCSSLTMTSSCTIPMSRTTDMAVPSYNLLAADNLSCGSPSEAPASYTVRQIPSPGKSGSGADIGVDPSQLIGKVLRRVRRSRTHPNVTLYFSDRTAFQIRVVGYDPQHRGIPKEIETDHALEPIFNHPAGECGVALTVANAAIITLADKAFALGERESRWDQQHSGVALKFREDGRWHCVWATLEEYSGAEKRACVFRSYHDVYLDVLDRPPQRHCPRTRKMRYSDKDYK